jgi:hypothetical protein
MVKLNSANPPSFMLHDKFCVLYTNACLSSIQCYYGTSNTTTIIEMYLSTSLSLCVLCRRQNHAPSLPQHNQVFYRETNYLKCFVLSSCHYNFNFQSFVYGYTKLKHHAIYIQIQIRLDSIIIFFS